MKQLIPSYLFTYISIHHSKALQKWERMYENLKFAVSFILLGIQRCCEIIEQSRHRV